MRINEILTESQNLEEGPLGSLGKGVGKVSKAVGTGVGGVKGAWQGAKDAFGQGQQKAFKSARAAVSGNIAPTDQEPEQTVAPAGSAGGTQVVPGAQAIPSNDPNVRQINKLVPKLKTRDLKSIKKTVDTTLQVRAQKANKGNLSKSFDQTVNKVTNH
jgi:hypothetical protein